MSGPADHDRSLPKPFLIEADGDGAFRLTLRQGRFNSQNYPVVTATVIDETFATAAAARAYAKSNFAAATGEFSVPARKPK